MRYRCMPFLVMSICVILLYPSLAWAQADVAPEADMIPTDTSNFNNNLSSADTDVQKALDTLDNTAGGGSGDSILIDGTAVTDSSGVDLQGGTGITITFNAAASPDTASFAADLGTTIETGEITDNTVLEPDLSESSGTPSDNDFLTYNAAGTNFTWVSANAGTDITADLEEETHATEHSLGGTDAITVTNLASGCTDTQVLGGTAAGTGVECQADADTQLSQEQVEDFAGALVTDGTGTHTDITITYQDATGDIDFVVDTLPNLTGTLDVNSGGTGATSLTDGGILLGSGTGAITALGVATNGQIPIGDGTTDPVLGTISGTANEIDVTNGAGSITVGIVASPTLDGTNFTGIAAGAYAAASVDGDDINSNIAGRSITLTAATPDTLDADAELYTDTKCIWFEDPTASDDFKTIWVANVAATITGISCETDQTVNMDLQIDDGTPAAVNGSSIACSSAWTEDTTLAGDTTMAANNRLDLAIASVSGTPTWVSICWEFTYDD